MAILFVSIFKQPFEFYNINPVYLNLRRNKITELDEILHLRNLKNLQVLWLSENPVAKDPNYRLFCIKHLPFLQKLDDKNVTPEEKEMAMNIGDFGKTLDC